MGRHQSLSFTHLEGLNDYLSRLSEEEKVRLLQRLTVETHVKLELHLQEEHYSMQKLDEVHEAASELKEGLKKVHEALFHPETGLVYIKVWICRVFKTTCWLIGGFVTFLAGVAAVGHGFGFW